MTFYSRSVCCTFLICVVHFLLACKKENTDTDTLLYNEIKNASGFIYYKGDNKIMQSSTQSGHSAYFRVRYNSTAYVALTDNGKLPVGAHLQTMLLW
ncbi:MAG: hypothetical protein ACK5QZ_10000 [Bacteroidota bacterium]